MALRRRFLMFGVLAVAAVGCASQRGTALDRALTPDSSVIMPPTTIEDLLLVPDAVVVARITGIAGSFEYTFPTAVGEATAAPGEPSWALTDLFTDYDADVLDALLPYGDAINEATITIRTLGDKPSAWRVDQDYLLFLMESSGEPPGDVFDVVGAWLGAFPLGGETTVYVGGEPVPYAVGLEPAEFVEQVRDAITD